MNKSKLLALNICCFQTISGDIHFFGSSLEETAKLTDTAHTLS